MPKAQVQASARGEVRIYDDAAALAEALADSFIEHAATAISARGTFCVALAGGSTPRAAYALLATDGRRKEVDWKRLQIFFGDERCVPPTSAESNYRMAHETLLSRVAIDEAQVHRMHGEEPPQQAATAYEHELRSSMGDHPIFDLVMLGLGPDAHTASWFPQVQLHVDALVDAPYVPKFSSHRLTLSPSLINAARGIVVATAGPEKQDAMRNVFGEAVDVNMYPAQRLQPSDGSLTWLTDRAAASGLQLASTA